MSATYKFRTDPGSGDKFAVIEKAEAGNTVELQRVTLDTDQLLLPATADPAAVTTAGESAAVIACEGKQVIMVKVTFSDTATSCDVRVLLSDYTASPITVYSDITKIKNLGLADGARYHGNAAFFGTLGAKEFKVRIENVAGGGNASAHGVAL